MAQIPVLGGIYTDEKADFRQAYPINLKPVALTNGISEGYLRPIDGIVKQGDAPGESRGGINWNGTLYRVLGTELCSIDSDGLITPIADVGVGGPCTFDYSFTLLAIASGGNLFYFDGITVTQVTDVNLGICLDVVWMDGYFVSTDGEFIVVSTLADPFVFNPLGYNSSEIDPDPILGVFKLRNELYAVNRYTIEVFRNVGTTPSPFQRITGAQIQLGAVGTHAACVYNDSIAFVGSGRNESPGVYLGVKAQSVKISTREIDTVLEVYSEAELSMITLEAKSSKGQNHLWVALPDRTIVYDAEASVAIGQAVWYTMTSGPSGLNAYTASDIVWCYNRWNVADPINARYGYLVDSIASQWGEPSYWQFGTTIVYNEGRGAIFHQLELVCLTGRIELGKDPVITTCYSVDGETWSQEKTIKAGKIGDRKKRLVWFQQGHMRNWRIQKFHGNPDAFLSIARLEVQLEPLA